jgi:hypothetical protein
MIATLLAILLVFMPCQSTSQVSDAQKEKFIELLKILPRGHEGFYTEAAVTEAEAYMPVLFALTEKDTADHDLYPFAAISRGLCDHKESRDYAVRHFAEIRHPKFKLFWGAMLFDAGVSSQEIVQFLRDALKSEGQAKTLSEMVGPRFEDLKRRVINHP